MEVFCWAWSPRGPWTGSGEGHLAEREGIEESPDVVHRVFTVRPLPASPQHPLALGTHWSQVGDKAGMLGRVVEDQAQEAGLDL